jgi:hypothetical protein
MISAEKRSPIPRVDHRREAARLRKLANGVTTAAVKARLLEQARQHDASDTTEAPNEAGESI